MKAIGIVICNYNKKDEVLNCIQSVLESKMQDFDLYVVDNASTDGSANAIQTAYGTKVRLIVNQTNLGGSGGFNAGLKTALNEGYPYLMCLDNDVLVDENAIGSLYEFLETHRDVGMAASKVYHKECPDYVQHFGLTIDFKNYCVTESKYLNCFEDGSMPEVVYSDSAATCSLMIKSAVIKKIGLMPEDNFLYWDDTEWGYLCNQAGYKVASYGKSQVLHVMGAKKESENTFPTYYGIRNWVNFFMKYTPRDQWPEMTSKILGYIFNIVYESNYKGQKNKMKTVMFAYDDAIHQNLGRASADKIFPLENCDSKLANLVNGKNKIHIQDDGYEKWGKFLFEQIKEMNPDAKRVGDTESRDIGFTFCNYIFELRDFSLNTVYIDPYDNIFATREDAAQIADYASTKKTFLSLHQPLFLYRTEKLRENH